MNPRTPTGRGPEPRAFGQAGRPPLPDLRPGIVIFKHQDFIQLTVYPFKLIIAAAPPSPFHIGVVTNRVFL